MFSVACVRSFTRRNCDGMPGVKHTSVFFVLVHTREIGCFVLHFYHRNSLVNLLLSSSSSFTARFLPTAVGDLLSPPPLASCLTHPWFVLIKCYVSAWLGKLPQSQVHTSLAGWITFYTIYKVGISESKHTGCQLELFRIGNHKNNGNGKEIRKNSYKMLFHLI